MRHGMRCPFREVFVATPDMHGLLVPIAMLEDIHKTTIKIVGSEVVPRRITSLTNQNQPSLPCTAWQKACQLLCATGLGPFRRGRAARALGMGCGGHKSCQLRPIMDRTRRRRREQDRRARWKHHLWLPGAGCRWRRWWWPRRAPRSHHSTDAITPPAWRCGAARLLWVACKQS